MHHLLKHVAILQLLLIPLTSLASNTGIPGYSQNATGTSSCHNCHTVSNFTNSSSTLMSGNTTLIAGTTGTYTFKLIAPRATSSNYGGFNISSSNGTLISTNGETTIINSELVQSGRKLATDTGSSFDVEWTFDWQAPAVTGTTTLFACALPVNGDGDDNPTGEHSTLDGRVACTTFNIQIQQAPTAQAGNNQTVTEGDAVSLDGGASTDTDGTINSYLWQQLSGTTAILSGENTVSASLSAPVVAANTTDELVFQLIVTDNDGLSDSSNLSIFVQDALVSNIAPNADAGVDQSINENTLVTLSASGSTDDGSIAAYLWQQTAGINSVTLSDTSSVSPSFTAPLVDASNDTLIFQVTVTDDLGVQSTASVNVTVNDVDTPPTAVISDTSGALISTLNNNITVTLYGNFSSDPEGPIMGYSWSQIAGSPIVNPGVSNASSFTFTTPDDNTNSIDIQLTVTGDEGIVQSSVTTSFTLQNQAPVANTGVDQLVNETDAVTLDATASTDADGLIVDYAWLQLSGSSATLINANTDTASFNAPNVPINTTNELIFQLTVTDNYGLTDVSTSSIFVQDALITNVIPIADAGTDQVVNEGSTVNISATASTDDGTIVAYLWEQTAGTNTITLFDNTAIDTSFIAPTLVAAGSSDTITLKLTVTDDLGVQASTTLNISVNDVDTPPVASITDNIGNVIDTIINNNGVTLYGNFSSDADGPISAYSWSQTNGPGIINPAVNNQSSFSFSTPDSPGSVIDIQLTVTGDEGSAQNSIIVSLALNNPPVVAAGADQTVTEGDAISLNGSTSFDADGSIVSYLWEQLSGPAAGPISNANTAIASFNAPAVASNTTAEQIFRLTATDNSGFSSSDISSIFVRDVLVANLAPIADAGANQSINENTLVTLNGSASTDDGTIVSYLWVQTAGTNTITLDNDSSITPTFTSPLVSNTGDNITFQLTVTDNFAVQSSSSVNIVINDVDTPPVAFISDASGTLITSISNNTQVTLYATFSNDVDGPITAYRWSQTAGLPIINPGSNTLNSFTFIAPNDAGNNISIELTVTGDEGSIENTVSVNLSLNNLSPLVDSGADTSVMEGNVIELHGIVSDVNNDLSHVQWRQINCADSCILTTTDIALPLISNQANVNLLTPPVSAQNSGEVLEFELTATDNSGLSTSSVTKITVNDNGITGFPDDATTFTSFNGLPMAISIKPVNPNITATINILLPQDNNIILDNDNRPLSFPYELVDVEISLSEPGTVLVTYYFPQAIENDFDYYQYLNTVGWINTSAARDFDNLVFNPITGWAETSEEVEFSADRKSVIILLTDGGPSDMNPAQKIISNNAGIGKNIATTNTQQGASGAMNPLAILLFWLLFYLRKKAVTQHRVIKKSYP